MLKNFGPRPCVRCGEVFSGLRCRACHRAYAHKYNREHKVRDNEKAAAYRRAWEQRHGLPRYSGGPAALLKWREDHPERYAVTAKARRLVQTAIRSGRLVRPDFCETCGRSGRIEAAHADYSKPLEVRWLCCSCHHRWDKREPKTLAAVSTATTS